MNNFTQVEDERKAQQSMSDQNNALQGKVKLFKQQLEEAVSSLLFLPGATPFYLLDYAIRRFENCDLWKNKQGGTLKCLSRAYFCFRKNPKKTDKSYHANLSNSLQI